MEYTNTDLEKIQSLLNNSSFSFNYLSKNESDTQNLAYAICKNAYLSKIMRL